MTDTTASAPGDPFGWFIKYDTFAPVFVQGAEPPEPLTREEAIAIGWTPLYLRAALASQPVEPAVPLTEEQIVMHGLMMVPASRLDSCADAFEEGVRFAERHHGITAAPDTALASRDAQEGRDAKLT